MPLCLSIKKSVKIFPKETLNIKCCICYELTNNFIKCSNEKCKEGIICLKCLKKMTPHQKTRCQICQVKTSVFQDVISEPIEIITHPGNKMVMNNKSFKNSRRCKVSECITIPLVTLLCIGTTYSTGLLFIWLISGSLITNCNPIVHMIIGSVFIIVLFLLIVLLIQIKWLCKKKISS
jgi:hypothetical protein